MGEEEEDGDLLILIATLATAELSAGAVAKADQHSPSAYFISLSLL